MSVGLNFAGINDTVKMYSDYKCQKCLNNPLPYKVYNCDASYFIGVQCACKTTIRYSVYYPNKHMAQRQLDLDTWIQID